MFNKRAPPAAGTRRAASSPPVGKAPVTDPSGQVCPAARAGRSPSKAVLCMPAGREPPGPP